MAPTRAGTNPTTETQTTTDEAHSETQHAYPARTHTQETMSSKFRPGRLVQKPPAVCKKGPPRDPVPFPTMNLQTLHAYAEYAQQLYYYLPTITGPIELVPVTANWFWRGETQTGDDYIRLTMIGNAFNDDYTHIMVVFVDGFFHDFFRVNGVTARTVEPFDSGLVSYPPDNENDVIRSRVLL